MEQALVENLHRQDLTPLEEAAAYPQLLDDFGLTHENIAKKVGKSRSAITNSVRLLTLPAAIQQLLATGRLSAGHAKALLGSPDRAFQEQLARQAADDPERAGLARKARDLERLLDTLRAIRPALDALVELARHVVAQAPLAQLWPPLRQFLEEWLLQPGSSGHVQPLSP